MQQPFKHLKLPEEHKPSLPKVVTTPKPERNRVVSPVRVAINKQAALLISPIRCWLSQPLQERPKVVDAKEIDRLKVELKIERNISAQVKDSLGQCRSQIKLLRQEISDRDAEIHKLKELSQSQAEIIRQLEDLKL